MSTSEPVLTADKLHDLRRRILSGTDYDKDDLRRSVKSLFGDRIAQAQAAATTSSRRPSKKVNLDDLIGDVEQKPKVSLDDLV